MRQKPHKTFLWARFVPALAVGALCFKHRELFCAQIILYLLYLPASALATPSAWNACS